MFKLCTSMTILVCSCLFLISCSAIPTNQATLDKTTSSEIGDITISYTDDDTYTQTNTGISIKNNNDKYTIDIRYDEDSVDDLTQKEAVLQDEFSALGFGDDACWSDEASAGFLGDYPMQIRAFSGSLAGEPLKFAQIYHSNIESSYYLIRAGLSSTSTTLEEQNFYQIISSIKLQIND